MSMSKNDRVGKISEVCSEIDVEWQIENYSSLCDEKYQYYDGPVFPFSDAFWFLRVYPNGEKEFQSDGWMGFYVMKRAFGNDRNITYKLGIKGKNGTVMDQKEDTREFTDKSSWGWTKFLESSVLMKRKDEFLPSDTLTVTCKLKNSNYRLVQWSLSESLLNVSQNLRSMLVNKTTSDIDLKVKGSVIKAHKAILETRSTIFAAMLNHDMVEKRTGVITIDDIEVEVFEQVLYYMYCGMVQKLEAGNVCRIYAAADKYDLQPLKEMCASYMEDNMSVDMVCDALVIADMYKEAKLKEFSKRFFIENSVEILKTDHWQKLVNENNAIAIQILASIVVENASKGK